MNASDLNESNAGKPVQNIHNQKLAIFLEARDHGVIVLWTRDHGTVVDRHTTWHLIEEITSECSDLMRDYETVKKESHVAKLWEEGRKLCHAIQSGVKGELELLKSDSGTPKHLRTGVNTVNCYHAALAKLCIARGLFTEEEYALAINEMLREEVKRYEFLLSAGLGKEVTLG